MQRSANKQVLIQKCVKLPDDQVSYINTVANKQVTHGRPNFSMALESLLDIGIKAHKKRDK